MSWPITYIQLYWTKFRIPVVYVIGRTSIVERKLYKKWAVTICSRDISLNIDDDRRLRVGLYYSSCKYSGANLWTHLYVIIKIVYMIRYLTGRQCNFWSAGVVWSWKRVRVTSLAAEFRIYWSFAMCKSDRPYAVKLMMSFGFYEIMPTRGCWFQTFKQTMASNTGEPLTFLVFTHFFLIYPKAIRKLDEKFCSNQTTLLKEILRLPMAE